MVMRFLFGLTGSLLSGSVVAVLFTALVQYVFPDTAEYQKPPSLHVAAPRDGLTARMFGVPEQSASPRASAALTAGIREPARSSEVDPPAREDPVAPNHGSNTGAAGLQPHPEPAALAQAGAQSKEQLLSASAPADLLTQSERDAEAPTTSPDRPPQQDETAHGMQSVAEVSAPGQIRNRVRSDNRKRRETSQPRRVTCLAERRREADQRGVDQSITLLGPSTRTGGSRPIKWITARSFGKRNATRRSEFIGGDRCAADNRSAPSMPVSATAEAGLLFGLSEFRSGAELQRHAKSLRGGDDNPIRLAPHTSNRARAQCSGCEL